MKPDSREKNEEMKGFPRVACSTFFVALESAADEAAQEDSPSRDCGDPDYPGVAGNKGHQKIDNFVHLLTAWGFGKQFVSFPLNCRDYVGIFPILTGQSREDQTGFQGRRAWIIPKSKLYYNECLGLNSDESPGIPAVKKILVFRWGGLGDLLVCLPALRLLRTTLARHRISLACRTEYGLVFKETGVVDDLISSGDPRLAPIFADSPYPSGLIEWLDGYGMILGWMQKKNQDLISLCETLGHERCLYADYGPDQDRAVSCFFLERTREFLIEKKNEAPMDIRQERSEDVSVVGSSLLETLPLSDRQKQSGLSLIQASPDDRIFVLHPGSGGQAKCWPLESFLEIMKRMENGGFRGIVVTGYADEKIAQRLEGFPLPPRWAWIHDPPLLHLAGLLARAGLYLGNDSGITHLAAAAGTKGLALFRNENLPAWRPFGRIRVLSAEELGDISTDDVWNEMIEEI